MGASCITRFRSGVKMEQIEPIAPRANNVILCPKCARRIECHAAPGSNLICPNCHNELELSADANGRLIPRTTGRTDQSPSETSPAPEPDPVLGKLKRYTAWCRVFQVLSGVSLLVMASYWLWNRLARHSAAEQYAYSDAARDQYSSLATEKVVVSVACIALALLFSLIAAQFRHYARWSIEGTARSE